MNKKQIYQKILGGIPDAIFVICGGIVKVGQGKYRSTTYQDLDPHGLLGGGQTRMIAAGEICRYFSQIKVVTTCGGKTEARTHSQIIAQELREYGASKEQILTWEDSFNTITELAAMVEIANEKDWHEIVVITNSYHIPRIKEMFKRLTTLAPASFKAQYNRFIKRKTKVKFVSAEEILIKIDQKYQKMVKETEDSVAYKKRVAAEKQGLKDLKAGKYQAHFQKKEDSLSRG